MSDKPLAERLRFTVDNFESGSAYAIGLKEGDGLRGWLDKCKQDTHPWSPASMAETVEKLLASHDAALRARVRAELIAESCQKGLSRILFTEQAIKLREIVEHAKTKTPCAEHYTLLLRDLEAALAHPEAAKQEEGKPFCGDCDGVGWVEGGAALQTTCKKCNGTGRDA